LRHGPEWGWHGRCRGAVRPGRRWVIAHAAVVVTTQVLNGHRSHFNSEALFKSMGVDFGLKQCRNLVKQVRVGRLTPALTAPIELGPGPLTQSAHLYSSMYRHPCVPGHLCRLTRMTTMPLTLKSSFR
jgi:hypothetical protein